MVLSLWTALGRGAISGVGGNASQLFALRFYRLGRREDV